MDSSSVIKELAEYLGTPVSLTKKNVELRQLENGKLLIWPEDKRKRLVVWEEVEGKIIFLGWVWPKHAREKSRRGLKTHEMRGDCLVSMSSLRYIASILW